MFRRHFSELLNGLCRDSCFRTVEIYHRIRLEEIDISGVRRKGCAAMTAVRAIGRDGVRDIRLTDQLPHLDTVRTLLDIAAPVVSPDDPVLGTGVGVFQHRHISEEGHNWRGLSRDILVNASGAELVVDCEFSLSRSNGVSATSDPFCRGLQGDDRNVLLLSPTVVMNMVRAGGFQGRLARGRATSMFHPHFDGVGATSWDWSRTPRTLHLTAGTLLFPDLPGRSSRWGTPIESVVREDHQWTGLTKNGGKVHFGDDVLESVEKVSDDMICFDGELYWLLPVVAVQGELKWD